jgi:hypothetical protein
MEIAKYNNNNTIKMGGITIPEVKNANWRQTLKK